MKKRPCVIALMCIMFMYSLGGCFGMPSVKDMVQLKSNRTMNKESIIQEAATKRVKKIRGAIEKKDVDAIYAMFSKTAREKGVNREEIEKFIGLMHENIIALNDWYAVEGKEEIYYGKEKISLRQGCDVTINGDIYVLALEECIRADRKEEKGDIGVTSIVFYFDSNDVGFPHEKVKEHGIYVFTKEDIVRFRDEILKKREEFKRKEEAGEYPFEDDE